MPIPTAKRNMMMTMIMTSMSVPPSASVSAGRLHALIHHHESCDRNEDGGRYVAHQIAESEIVHVTGENDT